MVSNRFEPMCARAVLSAALCLSLLLWSQLARATITQGDFAIYGTFTSREAGRWGEREPKGPNPSKLVPANYNGGSFAFNRWDLVEARQIADVRPTYHLVKNYNFLGRFDTIFIKDADFFSVYRGWYDAIGDIKPRGKAPAAIDWTDYSHREIVAKYMRDDLREYYVDLTFTDNFSARIGKQEVIWSEADALAGSDITNPNDLRFHWTHFEAPEDLRRNLRMIKFNYILPDFAKTANNAFEFFVIPGDWEGDSGIINASDPRDPYQAPIEVGHGAPGGDTHWTQENLPNNLSSLLNLEHYRAAPPTAACPTCVTDIDGISPSYATSNRISNSLNDSEFGARLSSLLPIGNGLQSSLIYLYEARYPKDDWNVNTNPAQFHAFPAPLAAQPGIYFSLKKDFPLTPGFIPAGTVQLHTRLENVRSHFVGLTGTYYDKDLTDIVYRYDFSWDSKYGIFSDRGGLKAGYAPIGKNGLGGPGGSWADFTRWIIAFDRPTLIPFISKQHTFFTFQYVATWIPNRPPFPVPFIGSAGKVRELSNYFFLNALDYIGGQLTTSNFVEWDIDNCVGAVASTNNYRYSENVLLGVNGIWYLGKSGRGTDPFAFSGSQNINEVEFKFTYEL